MGMVNPPDELRVVNRQEREEGPYVGEGCTVWVHTSDGTVHYGQITSLKEVAPIEVTVAVEYTQKGSSTERRPFILRINVASKRMSDDREFVKFSTKPPEHCK